MSSEYELGDCCETCYLAEIVSAKKYRDNTNAHFWCIEKDQYTRWYCVCDNHYPGDPWVDFAAKHG